MSDQPRVGDQPRLLGRLLERVGASAKKPGVRVMARWGGRALQALGDAIDEEVQREVFGGEEREEDGQ